MRFAPTALWIAFQLIAAAAWAEQPRQPDQASMHAHSSSSSIADLKADSGDVPAAVDQILKQIRERSFQPIKNGFTFDAELQKQGVADLNNTDWRVRLLALRDLVRLGTPSVDALIAHLQDKNEHVRQVCAMVLGLLRAGESCTALQNTLRNDKDTVVRSSAALSLGELGDHDALRLLKDLSKTDLSRDVRHQCEIAAYRIEHPSAHTSDVAEAFAALEESSFQQVEVGKQAVDFELVDTKGRKWRLADHKAKTVVLIWIFADWCPVCHGEFHELIELRDQFAQRNIELVTIECHDRFRARVMVGDELRPKYWFSRQSPQDSYRDRVWWRHLSDPAGAVGVKYGVDPMAFVVHSEWINRPSTIIVDPEGIVRFAYYGTYWGDRPSISQTLEMVSTGDYEFRHPKRLVISEP